VIKMTLALRHRQLPKTLHVDAPSSHVDWSAGGVALLSEARPWPQGERQRRAGISSFGISGTNVHLILEEAPRLDGERAIGYESSTDDGSAIEHEVGKERSVSGAQGQAHSSEVAGSPIVAWTLSGKGREALRAQAARLLELVESDEQLDPGDIGSSLARRIAFEDRAVVLGSDRSELLDGLAALVSGSAAPNVIEGPDETARGIVFMFTGQGAQRAGMGQELYEAIPAFREALDRVCTELDEHLREPLLEVLFAQSDTAQAERLDHTTFAQAGLFALEVALARLLEGWGVRPDYVIGHSIGELAAAHIAGVFSLADACRLVSARGRLMGELEEGGAMIAVQASEQEALASLVGMEGEVALAAVNGLSSVVLSGDEEAVLACAEVWSERGRKVKRLQVSHAFHSPRMDGMLEDFAEVARGVTYVPPRIPLVSNLTGRSASEELCSADYWVKHVRQTVRFADGIGWLGERGVSSFLEIGPGGVLSAMVADCPSREDREGRDGEEEEGKAPGRGRGGTTSRTADSARRALPVLSSGRPEVLCLTGALAELWTRGGTVDWHAMHARAGSRHVRLPTYPFRRRRYWMECASDVNSIERDLEGAEMALLDAAEHEDLDALALILQIEDERKRASLDDVMPSLSAWRRGSRERTIVDSWRYQVDWKPQTFEPVSVGARWLVVLQASHYEDPWLTGLLEALERQGVEVLAVVAETAGEMRGQLTAALRDVLEGLPEGQDVDCVLSLLALQEQPDPSHPSVPRGLAGTLAVVQALGDADVCAPLWMATRNAVSIGVQDRMTVSPVQAQSWGFGLTVGLENAQQRCGVVDLPHALDERVGGLLVDALMGARDEDQLAVRPAGVFVRRLAETLEAAQAGTAWIPPAGTILITGGTGGLGAHVARWLARAGAERLLLVSRRGAEAPGAEDLRIELSEMGVEVAICTCDVAESDQLAELIDAQGEENAPLSAVVHAAGIGFYGPIESMAVDDLERALGAKARGALNLAALTEHLDLSAFVLFSSIAGTLGSGQQGAYAAANACLDALALQLHARGLPAVSVAWGPWAGEGMVGAADGEAVEALRRRGLNCMLPELAIKALEQALLGDTPTVTVADIGWDVYAPLFCLARARPMIEDLPEVRSLSRENSSPHDRGAADELRRSLSETPAQERLQVLLGVVRTEVARVLAHPSAEAVDAKRAFADLGFDSLLAVELRNRLCAVTGLDLSATLVFDYPTPAAVADYLMDELTADSGDTSVSHALARLERTFGSLVDPDELTLARSRMTALLAKLDAIGQPARVGQQDEQTVAGLIDSASDEEIFGFIDEELGSGHSTDADASAANDHAGEAGETR
jgi:acyl transferase domain-containing protein/acyl carrier protein